MIELSDEQREIQRVCRDFAAREIRPVAAQVDEADTQTPWDTWHKAAAIGLPKRFITSIVSDPSDPKIVYVTLAGYSRRWLPVGAMYEGTANVGKGHVFKSTDAGEHFTDISGNLPDGPAESTLLYNGKLIVGTDTGVYISATPGGGGKYELLGRGLPNAPVFSLGLKPKAAATDPDLLYVATHGRGIYTYRLS